jgi:DNA-binding NtrC family response regulator
LLTKQEFTVANLLLVEDNKLLSLMEARHLAEAFPFLSLSVAKSGAEALASTRESKPSVIVLDCQLPGGKSCRLINELLDLSPDSKVIVTSAEPPDDLRGRRYRDKIFDILEKPFETEELVCVVGRALEATGSLDVSATDATATQGKDIDAETEGDSAASDRHQVLNVLSGILAGLRAFEADLEADFESPEAVKAAVGEYVPRLVEMVNKVTIFVKKQGHAG